MTKKKNKVHSHIPREELKNSKSSDLISKSDLLFCSFILLITLLVYFPSLNNDFVKHWDDRENVIDNPVIQKLSSGNISRMFSEPFAAMYVPLTMISYSVDFSFGGMKPGMFHFTNLLLHLLNVVLVFYFMKLMTGKTSVSVVCASVLALHPMNVEAVAWISARSTLLFSFWLLAASISYLFYLRRGFHLKYYAATILFFLFACLSKSAAIIFPLVMVLLDFHERRKPDIRFIADKVIFVLAAAVFGYVTLMFRESSKHIVELDKTYELGERLLFVVYSAVFYILKFFAPLNLSAFYAYPDTSSSIPAIFFAAPVFLMLILILPLMMKKLRREYLFGLGFYFATIILVLKIVPIGMQITADRYAYLPFMGISFFAGHVFEHFRMKSGKASRQVSDFMKYFFIVFIIVCAVLSFQRIPVWKNGVTLFSDVIQKEKTLEIGYFNRAIEKTDINDRKGAIEDYRSALSVNPSYTRAVVNLGNLLEAEGKSREAVQHYNRLLQLKQGNHSVYFGRGNLFFNMGDFSNAIKDFSMAIQLRPDYMEAYTNRGSAYLNSEEDEKAILDFSKSIELNPSSHENFFYRGMAKSNLSVDPCPDFREAARLGSAEAVQFLKQVCK